MLPSQVSQTHETVETVKDYDIVAINNALPACEQQDNLTHQFHDPQGTQASRGRKNLETHMIALGWCPHQVRNLSQKFDLHTFAYIATVPRSHFRLQGHQLCQSREVCVAYNTDPGTYKILHTTVNCACPTVLVKYKSLMKVIRKDRVPLVSIERITGGLRYKLHIHSRSRRSKYVAVSHVWADGLGNPFLNGLPACQVEQLMFSLNSLQLKHNPRKSCLFWMDTLCIPVGLNDVNLRLAQIDSMASIYKGAMYGLVLDAELMSTVSNQDADSQHSSLIELRTRAHLACSIWMSRSWTLQEGQLPPTLAIQYKNGMAILGRYPVSGNFFKNYGETFRHTWLSGNETLQRMKEADNSHIQASVEGAQTNSDNSEMAELLRRTLTIDLEHVSQTLFRDCFTTFFSSSNFANIKPRVGDEDFSGEKPTFAAVWDELTGRSTTKAEDIPLIMTNMLDLTNDGLLDLDGTAQMFQTILLSLKEIPLSIFYNRGPRQGENDHHHNRWIPTKIGHYGMSTSNQYLTVQPTYVEYHHSTRKGDQDTSVYRSNSLVPLTTGTCLTLGNGTRMYTVQPSLCAIDRFDINKYEFICIIAEDNTSEKESDVLRGACFNVETQGSPPQETNNNLMSRIFAKSRRSNNHPHWYMIFYCPLTLQRVDDTRTQVAAETAPIHLNPLTTPCNLRIRYDPLPNFMPLRPRRTSTCGFALLFLTAYILIVVAGLIVFLKRYVDVDHMDGDPTTTTRQSGGFLAKYTKLTISIWYAAAMVAFGLCLTPLFIWAAGSVRAWKRIRAYTARRRGVGRGAV